MSLELTQLVLRPNTGTVGCPITVRSNFFEVTNLPNLIVHHYDVTIAPVTTPVGLSRPIIKQFESRYVNGDNKAVFDGKKNLFCFKPLDNRSTEPVLSYPITLPPMRNGQQDQNFMLILKKAGEINMEELARFLKGQYACTSNCLTAIMFLDILIRQVPSSMYTTVGRSFFTPNNAGHLSNGADVWQGFYQSARPTKGKMMINIDVSAAVFHAGGPLPDVIVKILGGRRVDELCRGVTEPNCVKLSKILKHLKVNVTHRGNTTRTFKISSITKLAAKDIFFEDQQGSQVSVTAYFESRYNCRLNYPYLPCIEAKSKNKSLFLPLEVCNLLPGQRVHRKLNHQQTLEMAKFTSQRPSDRANKIKQGVQLMQYQDNAYMQNCQMKVKPHMAVIKARVLPTPKISYSSHSQEPDFVPKQGAWNLKGKKVVQGSTLSSWSIVNFAGMLPVPVVQRFVRELSQSFVETGMNVTQRLPPITSADPLGNLDRTLKESYLRAGSAAKSEPQLILCILPNTGSALYAAIKRICDTTIGVATQCVQSKYIKEVKKQYCANVCLKVNVKLGGQNLKFSNQVPFLAEVPAIIMGADVTHPPPGSTNQPSIAAICGSMDSRASKYMSTVRSQKARTEIIADLANMVVEILRGFYSASGQKPQKILFYRDGVSEGQFKQVMDDEVLAIKAACNSLEKGYQPTLTYVVVQKRHHARFFPLNATDADRTGNCLPGTVIDTDIVHPFEFDFYLQSQAGIQGTSRPAHYHVLHDENMFTADALQELSYRLCYLYVRATRSVSIIPAVMYADLVAARARFHRKEWNDDQSSAATKEEDLVVQVPVNAKLARGMYYM